MGAGTDPLAMVSLSVRWVRWALLSRFATHLGCNPLGMSLLGNLCFDQFSFVLLHILENEANCAQGWRPSFVLCHARTCGLLHARFIIRRLTSFGQWRGVQWLQVVIQGR